MTAPTGPFAPARPLVEAPLRFQTRSGGAQAKKDNAFIICPKCDAPCFIRKSERITPTVKHLTAHCTNSGCGHIFMAEVVFIHSLVPGIIDRPDLDLPVCPADQVPHVLPPARDGPAEDDEQMTMFRG